MRNDLATLVGFMAFFGVAFLLICLYAMGFKALILARKHNKKKGT